MRQDNPPADELLAQGAAAMRSGERARARQLLAAAVRADPRNAQTWFWLSGALDDPAQQRECLERALALDPEYAAAQHGLEDLRVGSDAPHPSPLSLAGSGESDGPHPQPHSLSGKGELDDPLSPAQGAGSKDESHPAEFLPSPLITLLLGALGGIGVAFDWVAWRGLGAGASLGAILVVVVLAGVPLGISALVLGGVLLRMTGRGLGGVGDTGAVRAGLSWAAIPPASGLLLWVGQVALMPTVSLGAGAATHKQSLAISVFWAVHGLLILYSAYLAIAGVAAAHQISRWRAVAAWLMAALLVLGTMAVTFTGSALLISLRGG